jgi:hypothetical protein
MTVVSILGSYANCLFYSASTAVVVRIPFLPDYKETDFLCMLV